MIYPATEKYGAPPKPPDKGRDLVQVNLGQIFFYLFLTGRGFLKVRLRSPQVEKEVRMERDRRDQIDKNAERFKKIRRKLSAMGRIGEQPKPELTKEFVSLDEWLTKNTYHWRSHFGFKRDEEI